MERHLALHELDPRHHHPGDPEKDDVVAGDQHIRLVVFFKLRRLLRPAEGGIGPEGGGEPGVEDVGVAGEDHEVTLTFEVIKLGRIVVGVTKARLVNLGNAVEFFSLFGCLLGAQRAEHDRFVVVVAAIHFRKRSVRRRPIPNRYLMPPPELAGDAPRLDVLQPVEIGLFPVLRHEFRAPVPHRFQRRLGERRGVHKPLIGQHRLDDDL